MEDFSTIEDLVGGYQSYTEADQLSVSAETSAPATTPFCGFVASFAFSYITTYGPG